MEESHQEATEKEVERILSYLRSYFADDRKYWLFSCVDILRIVLFLTQILFCSHISYLLL